MQPNLFLVAIIVSILSPNFAINNSWWHQVQSRGEQQRPWYKAPLTPDGDSASWKVESPQDKESSRENKKFWESKSFLKHIKETPKDEWENTKPTRQTFKRWEYREEYRTPELDDQLNGPLNNNEYSWGKDIREGHVSAVVWDDHEEFPPVKPLKQQNWNTKPLKPAKKVVITSWEESPPAKILKKSWNDDSVQDIDQNWDKKPLKQQVTTTLPPPTEKTPKYEVSEELTYDERPNNKKKKSGITSRIGLNLEAEKPKRISSPKKTMRFTWGKRQDISRPPSASLITEPDEDVPLKPGKQLEDVKQTDLWEPKEGLALKERQELKNKWDEIAKETFKDGYQNGDSELKKTPKFGSWEQKPERQKDAKAGEITDFEDEGDRETPKKQLKKVAKSARQTFSWTATIDHGPTGDDVPRVGRQNVDSNQFKRENKKLSKQISQAKLSNVEYSEEEEPEIATTPRPQPQRKLAKTTRIYQKLRAEPEKKDIIQPPKTRPQKIQQRTDRFRNRNNAQLKEQQKEAQKVEQQKEAQRFEQQRERQKETPKSIVQQVDRSGWRYEEPDIPSEKDLVQKDDYDELPIRNQFPETETKPKEKLQVEKAEGEDDGHYPGDGHPECKPEDNIPGKPNEDYATYTAIPQTGFKCSDQQYPGYYGDVEAKCQVFHVCQEKGRQDDFLCPIGTVFNQRFFVCDWWKNYDCEETPNLYSLNADIYDYSQGAKDREVRRTGDAPLADSPVEEEIELESPAEPEENLSAPLTKGSGFSNGHMKAGHKLEKVYFEDDPEANDEPQTSSSPAWGSRVKSKSKRQRKSNQVRPESRSSQLKLEEDEEEGWSAASNTASKYVPVLSALLS